MIATDPNAVAAAARSERRLSSIMNPALHLVIHPQSSISERNFGALVFDAPSFVVPTGQPAGLGGLDRDANAKTDAQALFERAAEPLALGTRERRRRIDPHQDVIEAVHPSKHDLELIDPG